MVPSSTHLCSGILQDLKKLCISGQLSDAICGVDSLSERGIPISISIIFWLLQACIENKNLRAGRQIYVLIIRNGFEMDTFLGCHLVRMFSTCGSLLEADQTFSKLRNYDSFTWTAIISAHAKFGCGEQALQLYNRMLEDMEPVEYAFTAALQACSSTAALSPGNIIHAHIVESSLESDVCIGNTLINMYAKCGSVEDACSVFDEMPKRGIVAWSSIISGYADESNGQKALRLFSLMLQDGPQPNIVTYMGILRACSRMACLIDGKLVHALIIENNCALNLKVTNVLIDMHGKCGSLEDADFIFQRLCERTVITWSIMLSVYADYGHDQVTLQLFQQMQHEGVESDSATFAGVLKACSQLDIGKLMHVILLEKEPKLDDSIGSILIDMYFRLLCPADAHKVFRILPRPSVLTWNGMIAGFLQHGLFEEAMCYFQGMQLENLVPDDTTYANIVKACSDYGQLAWGELLCSLIIENSCDSNVVGSALVSMYAKCGSLDDACRLFDKLARRDVVTWSAMIAGYVLHGFGQEALKFYCLMQLEGKESDCVTFLCILKACSLLSALHQGRLVHAQVTDSKWESDVLVRNILIDMYGKCGSPQDALIVFNDLPVKTETSWNTMISAFAHHGKYHLALELLKGMQQEGLKPNDATFTTLLAACNQFGLVHEGRLLFSSLSTKYGITPRVDHYACLIELLSHAGCLVDAVTLVTTLPFAPDLVAWTSLLNHSKAHGDLKLGKQCLDSLVSIDSIYASGYAIMSNLLADASLSEDADNMQKLRKQAKAWKKPGEAFIEVNNEVYGFVVHDQSQQKCELLGRKLHNLSARMKTENYMPLLDLVLHDACDQKSKL